MRVEKVPDSTYETLGGLEKQVHKRKRSPEIKLYSDVVSAGQRDQGGY